MATRIISDANKKINNEITKKVAVILQQNKNLEQKYMRSVGAFIINGFMKIPGLKVLERIKIQKNSTKEKTPIYMVYPIFTENMVQTAKRHTRP